MSYNIEKQILDENGNAITSMNTEIYNGIRYYLPDRWYNFGMQTNNLNNLSSAPFVSFASPYSYVMIYFIPNDISVTKWRTKFATNTNGGTNLRFGIYNAKKEKMLDLDFARTGSGEEVVELDSPVTFQKGYYYVVYKGGYPQTTDGFVGFSQSSTTATYNKKLFPGFTTTFNIPRYSSTSTTFPTLMPTLSNANIGSINFPILIHNVTSVNIN